MFTPIENTLTFQAAMYDQMKPVTRKVLDALLWFEHQRKLGRYKAVYPSHKMLAKLAACSVSSVKTSLEELEECTGNILIKTRRLGFKTCIYKLNDRTFEFLYLLKSCRLTDRWKAVRLDVIQGLAEDEHFLAERLYKKGELSTTKLATSTLSKLATIKSLLLMKCISERLCTEKDDCTRVMNETKKPRKEVGIITDLPLSEKDRTWLSENYAYVDLRKARDDYDVFRNKWGNTIYNPAGFINSRAMAHTKKRVWR